jgi:hypothetical protein
MVKSMKASVRSKALKVLKKNMKKKAERKSLYGIKQGVGGVTQSPYPKTREPRRRQHPTRLYLNAMHPSHLALPRAVGGYTVIRTTDIINAGDEAFLFGTFKGPGGNYTDTTWLTTIAVRNEAGGVNNPINGTNNAFFYGSAALSASTINGARMVPAAITVQIMCGESMQNADGICYIGRSRTVLDLMGDTRSWNTVLRELVSYSAPRLCSGGKLALRGVEVDAIPNNMSVLSDFVPRRVALDGLQTWTENTYALDFEGFAPIFVFNPDKIELKYLVTVEWRMRFDPLNPAYAGHKMHPPASETTWSQVIQEAEAVGNGVRDIADVVADIGIAAVLAA